MGRAISAIAAFIYACVLCPASAPGPFAAPSAAAPASGAAWTVALSFNGAALPAPAAAPRPVPTGSAAAPAALGYGLGELFPPQLEAWRLEYDGRSGPGSVEADDLGERLYGIRLVAADGGWDLLLDRAAPGKPERIRGVSRLGLYGDRCPEGSLEVWVSWEGVPELKAEIAAWARRAGVAAKVVDVPSIKSKLVTVLRGGGRMPDLAMVQSDYLPDLAAAGALQPIDGLRLPEASGKGSGAFRLDGRLLASPFYCDAQLVYYSTELVRSAPPADWCLADMARTAAASGARVGAAWNAYSAYWFLPFVVGFGKDGVVGVDGRMDVRHPAYAAALGFLRDSVASGFLEPMERDAMMAYFASGKAAFILSGSYSVPEFKRLGLPFGVAPYPLVSPGGKRVAPMLDYKGWAVTRSAGSPALARRLVQYLSSAAVQASFCYPQGKLPANDDAWDLLPAGDPYLETLRASYDAGVAIPPAPAYGEFKNASWKLLRLFLDGSIGQKETIDSLATILGE